MRSQYEVTTEQRAFQNDMDRIRREHDALMAVRRREIDTKASRERAKAKAARTARKRNR